jgi:hypothetical protein
LNLGGNRGFQSQPIIPVGRVSAGQVATADFNADLYDDVAVVTSSSRANAGADEVGILLNTGAGSFPERPQYFVVGQRAAALTINDFNNDGAPDIAVLNTLTGTSNRFSISVLLNITAIRSEDQRVVGTGFFDVPPPFEFSCPATITGIPVGCIPQDITSGDFDADGAIDLAVSVATFSTGASVLVTPGLLLAFAGDGNGTFSFATQVRLGTQPRGLAAGDVTDDGLADVVVTEFTNNSVRIVRSIKPSERLPGQSCRIGTQCLSGNCVDGVCCATVSCPNDMRCNIPGQEGVCAPRGPNGARCGSADHCISNSCVDGFCCAQLSCPAFQYCNTGQCGPPAPNGVPCELGEHCNSGFCVDGYCCSSPQCPSTQACNIPGFEGQCLERLPEGNPCQSPQQCLSGFCVDGACCRFDSCPLDQSCNVSPFQGVCTDRPPPTPTPTPTATATLTFTPSATPTPQPAGATCTDGTQCTSSFCVNGICCLQSTCPAGQRCDIFGAAGQCSQPNGIDQECRVNTDCASGNCEPGTPPRCRPPHTPTPTRTPTPLPLGSSCSADGDCQSRFCTDSFCCEQRPCPNGQFCNISGREGQCSPPKGQQGEQCNPNEFDPCEPGLVCNGESVCCNTANCPAGQRCDIRGLEGACATPLGTGAQCNKNSDCLQGLECRLDTATNVLRCLPPRTPTPTLIPPLTPTRQAPVVVESSRGGGCSIGGGGGSDAAWLLALVPFLLWVGRAAEAPLRRRK